MVDAVLSGPGFGISDYYNSVEWYLRCSSQSHRKKGARQNRSRDGVDRPRYVQDDKKGDT